MRSIIIGGGVAGCAMAAALGPLSQSEEITIVERRLPDAPGGMGFLLMPNGLEALRQIAPAIDWTSSGRWIERASLRASDGDILAEHALEPALCVSRVRFLALLREAALASACTRFVEGASVASIARDGSGGDSKLAHAAILDDGRTLEGDCFFGCDGARSQIREHLFPEARLSDAAVHEIVSVAEAPELARELGTTFRKYHDPRGGLAVGMLAEGGDRVVWFIQMDARAHRLDIASPDGFAAFADAALADWPADVLEAIACTDFARSHLWQTRDLPPLRALHQANVALLGDAAHACLPFTSQGANGALVDAALLGRLLRPARTPRESACAFAEYTRIRRPHHRRMFEEGRRLRDAFLVPVGAHGPALPLVA